VTSATGKPKQEKTEPAVLPGIKTRQGSDES